VTGSQEAIGHRISAEAARRARASAIGLNCAVGAVVSTVEALCDSDLPPTLRERRSQELYAHLGELHRALAALDEAVLPPAISGDLVVVEGDPVLQVPVRRWLGQRPSRRPGWGSALGGLEPPTDR
jgi:hypothetical protein